MRKLLCGNTLLAVALPFLILGCGGSPTAPSTQASTPANVATPTPTPTPSPDPTPTPTPAPSPTPAPTPAPEPSPSPAPTPSPAPAPAPIWTFDGSTDQAHWYGDPILPGRFDLEIADGSVRAAGHSFPILSQAPGNVYVTAGTRNVETLTLEYYGPSDGSGSWRWTYTGLPGQASGTLIRRSAQ